MPTLPHINLPPCPRRARGIGGACARGRSLPHGRLRVRVSTAAGLCHRKGSRPEWAQRPNSVTECGDALPLSGPGPPRHKRGPPPLRTHLGRPQRRSGGPGGPSPECTERWNKPLLSVEHTRWRRVWGSAGADTPRPASHPPSQKWWGTSSGPPIASHPLLRQPTGTLHPEGRQRVGTRAVTPSAPGSPPARGATSGRRAGTGATFPAPPARPRCPRPAEGVERPRGRSQPGSRQGAASGPPARPAAPRLSRTVTPGGQAAKSPGDRAPSGLRGGVGTGVPLAAAWLPAGLPASLPAGRCAGGGCGNR